MATLGMSFIGRSAVPNTVDRPLLIFPVKRHPSAEPKPLPQFANWLHRIGEPKKDLVAHMKFIPMSVRLLLLPFLVTIVGCGGGGQKPTAKVQGKVTFNGQPVPGGTLSFAPVAAEKGNEPGKSASGGVNSDGTYVLSTYTDKDGAVVGKHRVIYLAASAASTGANPDDPASGHSDETAAANPAPASPFQGLKPKAGEVEVKSGSNTIDIELVADPNQPAPTSQPQ
ncbi:MAG: hypothetical protein HZA46_06000 [Planctomycetales bacterium]|nr:hypothetical protein [Planctomycetales bacterium]